MRYRLRLASCAFVLVAMSAAAGACGHLPFDELPETADGSIEAGSFVDATSDAADVTQADGQVDARPPETDAGEDARFVVDGAPDAACSATGDCQVIYVSAATGKKTNPGTSDLPVDEISTALALVTNRRNELHVASGDYKPVRITGEQDVRIFGGFQCSSVDKCTWGKDDKETVVTANDLAGNALFIGAGHGRATIIDNIHFKGAQGVIDPTNVLGAITVLISSATPTLQHLVIEGPQSKGGSVNAAKRSAGVMIRGKQEDSRGVLIDDCTISGGAADALSAGVYVEDGPSALPSDAQPVLDLTRSRVGGGSAPTTFGVLLTSSGPNTKIHENEKLLALPATQQGPSTESWAIGVTGTADITRNQINPTVLGSTYCKGAGICGGIRVSSATVAIRNNIVHGVPAPQSAAISLELGDGAHPQMIINSNVLEGGGDPNQDGFSTAIFVRNQNNADATVGLVRNNILLGGKGKAMYGVYEIEDNKVSGHLAALDHNDIRAETAAYHAWYSTPSLAKDYAVADLKNAPVANAADGANIGADCLLDATFHLQQHSPCINAGTKVEAPNIDIDGDPRPNPPGSADGWDIGADESAFAAP